MASESLPTLVTSLVIRMPFNPLLQCNDKRLGVPSKARATIVLPPTVYNRFLPGFRRTFFDWDPHVNPAKKRVLRLDSLHVPSYTPCYTSEGTGIAG